MRRTGDDIIRNAECGMRNLPTAKRSAVNRLPDGGPGFEERMTFIVSNKTIL